MGNLLRCHGSAGRRRRRSACDKGDSTATAKVADADADGGYAEKARIDDEVLVARYLHLMHPTAVSGSGPRPPREGGGCSVVGERRHRVSFRAESFDSQSSTTSERREFVIGLVDSLPETFVDDALPPASARGRLVSWSSDSSDIGAAADPNDVFIEVELPTADSSTSWSKEQAQSPPQPMQIASTS